MNKRRRMGFWLKKREQHGLRHQGINHLPDYCLRYDGVNGLDNSVAGSFVVEGTPSKPLRFSVLER